MTKPYGKFQDFRKRSRQDDGTSRPSRGFRIKINGRYDLEDFSLLLQQAVARLEDSGVSSIERCAIYLEPLDRVGERAILRSPSGSPIESIELAHPVVARFSKVAQKS